jgi:hypothetical protein
MAVKQVPRKAKPRTKYNHGISHYSALYEIPYATIKKYHGKSYPLDDPKALLEKLMAQTAPNRTNIVRLKQIVDQGHTRRVLPKRKSVPTAEPPEDEEPPEPKNDAVGDAMEGLQREMHRLKVETDEAYRAYRKENDPILKSSWWKTWKEMLDQWGKLAKLAPEAEREAGTMAKAADIEATWSRTVKEIRTSLESMKRRMSAHATFKALNPVDVELAIESEVIKVMTLLSGA